MDTAARTQNSLLHYHHCDYATVTRHFIHKENDWSSIRILHPNKSARQSTFTVIAFGQKAEPSQYCCKHFQMNNTLIFCESEASFSQLII